MKSAEIRQMFLDYFKSKNHMVEPGASLIPIDDPTLLWINSGVAALKKYFDGSIIPKNPRIVNVQKSIRTNDIENVGKTARHHTFFEMLGNFSIGDYFKKEAIEFAWEFLTSPEWMGFDQDKMYVSVHSDDQEAYDIWVNDIKFDPHRILKTDANFWQIGDGPCGPNSELFYDRGPDYDPDGIGERLFFEDIENDRYVEIWNVVFSQYNGIEGVPRSEYEELPQKNIDTGLGFERLVCVAQDVHTNYDTDLFMPIIEAIGKQTDKSYVDETMAYRVIADHIRTVVFALSDGALFSNEGRGYVLRRLLRRAVRYGMQLGIQSMFLKDLVPVVVDNMKDFYTDLTENQKLVETLIEAEEKRFKTTLTSGETMLMERLKALQAPLLDGVSAFTLYDTYGFPLELTQEIAAEHGVDVDVEGFNEQMKLQQERARKARVDVGSMAIQSEDLLHFLTPSEFVGYEQYEVESEIIGLFKDGHQVQELTGKGYVITKATPFYAESGGQVADAGVLVIDDSEIEVADVIYAAHHQHMHLIDTQIPLRQGQTITLKIDQFKREKTMANHTLAHLLQAALKLTLGEHVHQAGSYVSDKYMRFDFTHFEKVSDAQLQAIEAWINQQVYAKIPLTTQVMELKAAKAAGATALFNEKYDDHVRVVSIGDVSMELCGGTHISNTIEIGVAKLVSEESIGSGIRRIVCVSQAEAYAQFQHYEMQLEDIAETLRAGSIINVEAKVAQTKATLDAQQKQIATLQQTINQQQVSVLLNQVEFLQAELPVIVVSLDDQPLKQIKPLVESTLAKLGKGIVFIGAQEGARLLFVCGAHKDLVKQGIDCSNLVKLAAQHTGGDGGGRKDFAQAGGKDTSKLQAALQLVQAKIRDVLLINE